MIIITNDTAVDLSRINGMMKVYDRLTLFGQGGDMPNIKGAENQLMVEFFFRKPAISADDILRLAEQIIMIRDSADSYSEALKGVQECHNDVDFHWPQE